jgi:hypothetical protein
MAMPCGCPRNGTAHCPIEVQKALKGADYPAKGEDLAKLARRNRANEAVVKELESHRRDTYGGPNEVQHALFDR